MTINTTKTDALPEETKATNTESATLSKEQPSDLKKIAVDIAPGVSVELDVETAKKVIQHRDSRSKGYKELEAKLKSAEEVAKNEASRAQLIEAMKNQDVAAVEAQVSAKYRDTISRFERKVFDGEIKSALAKHGCLPDALGDASKLVVADAKPELDGDVVKLNGVAVEDYVKGWIEKRPHLVAVKATGRKEAPAQPAKDTGFEKFASGLFNKK